MRFLRDTVGRRKGANRMSKKNEFSRRRFIKNTAVGGAALMVVPRYVLGRGMTPPSDLLNIAGVGVGGMGRANLIALASQNIVALCDVDWGYAGKAMDRLDGDITTLKARLAQPETVPSGTSTVEFDRVKAQARLDPS